MDGVWEAMEMGTYEVHNIYNTIFFRLVANNMPLFYKI